MKKTETDDNPYLWDRSGEPDPDVVRLETLLGQLRERGTPPALPDRSRRSPDEWKLLREPCAGWPFRAATAI